MRCSERHGFTLIELLLVLVIIGIVTAVTVPNLVRSMSGSRLAVASRGIVTAGRYARSMAVLTQREISLVLDLEKSELSVQPSAAFAITRISNAPEEDDEMKKQDDEAGKPAVDMLAENDINITRKFERVLIERVVMDGGKRVATEGKCSIMYERNGRCEPYQVVVRDDEGLSMTIKVDAISSAKTFKGSG